MLNLYFSRFTSSVESVSSAESISRFFISRNFQNSLQSSPNLEFDMVKFKIPDRALASKMRIETLILAATISN
jgi:hypothetical protein